MKIKIAIFIVVAIASLFVGLKMKNVIVENNQLKRNIISLSSDNEDLQERITVDKEVFSKILDKNMSDKNFIIDSLKLKIKDIQKYTKTTTVTKFKVKTVLKDSIIYLKDTVKIYKFINFSNGWYNIVGNVHDSIMDVNVSGVDTIYYVTHKFKTKRFFISRWFESPKYKIMIRNKNPYQKITVKQDIEMK